MLVNAQKLNQTIRETTVQAGISSKTLQYEHGRRITAFAPQLDSIEVAAAAKPEVRAPNGNTTQTLAQVAAEYFIDTAYSNVNKGVLYVVSGLEYNSCKQLTDISYILTNDAIASYPHHLWGYPGVFA